MGQIVVLAEKPSVGRDIARVLGCRTQGKGCLSGNGYTVTWAIGHLVTLVEPDELDERYKHWSMETLPILPENIPLKVISSSRDQYKIVKDIINAPDTDRIICATDAGRGVGQFDRRVALAVQFCLRKRKDLLRTRGDAQPATLAQVFLECQLSHSCLLLR